jgi:valine--pyruvate aminotransferase
MNWSDFGKKLTNRSGILELMDDLGKAMQSPGQKYMLGGGNPASIPEMNKIWRQRMQEILANGDEFERGLVNYDTPQGKDAFLKALASLLKKQFGWELGPENIGITNGSQTAFFILFNLFSGQLDESRGQGLSRLEGHEVEHSESKLKKILLPLTPEYIGYADQGIGEEHFISVKPKIEYLGDHEFKYHVDFESLPMEEDIAAICVSRPTNPTGNVLSDDEILKLDALAKKHDIPLMIDNAYGTPFPGILFTEANPIWNENIILSLSLSKLGLPSTRTGIIVARKEVIQAVAAVNAIVALSNNTLGQMIVRPLLESGNILELCKKHVHPFYLDKSEKAQKALQKHFHGFPWRVHKSEGALFLWVWFENTGLDSFELYERLKKKNVIIVPGRYFFYGLREADEHDWAHKDECIRLSFAQDDHQVDEGIRIIGEEVRSLLAKNKHL